MDEYSFRIASINKSGDLTGPDDVVTLTVLLESAEEDITYRWWWMGNTEAQVGATELPDNGPVCYVTLPGQYKCRAINRNGLESTAFMTVSYLGGEPVILQQPQIIKLPPDEDKTSDRVKLTVNAIASDNRTAVLEYVWEYWSNGDWLNCGSGSNRLDLQLATGEEEIYRCKVTDTRTGAYTISSDAKAGTKLSYVSGSARSIDGYQDCFEFYFEGGYAPYTVKIYKEVFIADAKTAPKSTHVLVNTKTINDPAGLNPYSVIQFARTDGIVYSPDRGELIHTQFPTSIYVIVTDSFGQICQSEVIQAN